MISRDYRKHIYWYYNNFAWFYDRMEFLRKGTRHRVVQLSECKPGEKVLDVCAGTGELSIEFANRGISVTAIDIARNMLKRGAKKAYLNTSWVQMDAQQLSFPNKLFDVSTLSLALHHMPESIQHIILREMVRVTRRKVVIVEPNPPDSRIMKLMWAYIFSVLDESEYVHEWVNQDLTLTCLGAGLEVNNVDVLLFGIHKIYDCAPVD